MINNLKYFNISYNKLEKEGSIELANFLEKCLSLEKLELANTNLYWEYLNKKVFIVLLYFYSF